MGVKFDGFAFFCLDFVGIKREWVPECRFAGWGRRKQGWSELKCDLKGDGRLEKGADENTELGKWVYERLNLI